MIAHLTAEQLAAAGVELERQTAGAKAAIRDALLAGVDTSAARAKLERIAADIAEHAKKIAQLREEAETAREQAYHTAASEIARGSVDRLRFTLAAVAAPRPSKTLRGDT